MKCKKEWMRLYAVTDRAWTGTKNSEDPAEADAERRMQTPDGSMEPEAIPGGRTLEMQVEAALRGGATCVQLREKNLPREEFLKEAIRMAEICHRYHVPFIVNDDVEIALQSGADGVHVGQDDMTVAQVRKIVGPDKIIGVSAHTVEEALEAQKNGADYLGAGSVFVTSTKKNVCALPMKTLRVICEAVAIPVVAIGGITKENAAQLAGSGADGIAVVSAIFGAEDCEKAARELRGIVESKVIEQQEKESVLESVR